MERDKKSCFFWLILLVSVLFSISFAFALDYYVSPSGSGSSCTESSPCSLSTANNNLQAGDIAYLMAGTYTTGIAPSSSGTSDSNRITYTNYNNDINIR